MAPLKTVMLTDHHYMSCPVTDRNDSSVCSVRTCPYYIKDIFYEKCLFMLHRVSTDHYDLVRRNFGSDT